MGRAVFELQAILPLLFGKQHVCVGFLKPMDADYINTYPSPIWVLHMYLRCLMLTGHHKIGTRTERDRIVGYILHTEGHDTDSHSVANPNITEDFRTCPDIHVIAEMRHGNVRT